MWVTPLPDPFTPLSKCQGSYKSSRSGCENLPVTFVPALSQVEFPPPSDGQNVIFSGRCSVSIVRTDTRTVVRAVPSSVYHDSDYRSLAIRCLEDVSRRRTAWPTRKRVPNQSRVKQNERNYSTARFSALNTARTEASSMLVSTPAPQRGRPSARLIRM